MADLTYLVRHGEVLNPDHIVYADLDGFGLSALGRSQAAEAATRLPPGSTIVSSPLERAVETSEIIAAALDTSVGLDEELVEWHMPRRWAGEVWEAIDTRFPGELTAYLEHPHDLPFAEESLDALAGRVADAVRRHRREVNGPLVIVSHQDPLQAVRLELTGRPLATLQQNKPGHGSVITLEGTGDGEWRKLSMWAPAQGEMFPPIES